MCMRGAKSPVDGGFTEACAQHRGMWNYVNQTGASGPTCGVNGDWFESRTKASAGVP
jgi:hypothetical protein